MIASMVDTTLEDDKLLKAFDSSVSSAADKASKTLASAVENGKVFMVSCKHPTELAGEFKQHIETLKEV